MAIRLVTGLPGSGKSYYCVDWIVNKYCVAFGDSYVLREDIILITNIDSLLLDSYSLDDLILKAGSVKLFFTLEYQKRIVERFEGKSVVYVIDEAQKYLDRKFYDRGVFGFLESHRHLGIDLWLVTQNANLLARDVLSLAEIEIRATPRTLALLGFSYIRRSQGQIIGREVRKRKKNIFSLYCSQVADEAEKIQRPYIRYLGMLCGCLIVGVIIFQITFSSWGNAKETVKKDVSVVPMHDVVKTELVKKANSITTLRKVNYILFNGCMSLYDWSLGQFVPCGSFSYPLVIDGSGHKPVIYARVPVSADVPK